jgi:L-alanine-DL-glutamate epimerase-like enolase superfamily enzyme
LLCEDPKRILWNVRISKNGGFWRALHLLQLAAKQGVTVSLGCMVGETCVLSAAQRRLLQVGPPPRFVEGNYGRFLLADDLCEKSPRFGYGGRLSPLSGPGLGGRVDTIRLDRLAEPLRTVVV